MSAVRKSVRVKTQKKSTLLSDEFEYDETKFELQEEPSFEVEAKLELDVSSNISDILNCHSKEKTDDGLLDRTSFPNVMSKLQSEDGVENFVLPFDEDSNSQHMTCPLCDKHLTTDEELESHITEHSIAGDSQLLTCDVCGKMLPDLASYNRHLKTHTEDRPFQCGQCPKGFVDGCSLKRHMKSHDDDRPFSCEICQKSFRDTGSIGRHMLTHTERPRSFQCAVCNKDFTDKSGLKRHERTHSGVRPYTCDVCQKTFIDSGSFKRHLKIHIGIKNYHCVRCNRSFMEKQSLIRHQKTVCKKWDGSMIDDPDESNTASANDSHVDTTLSDVGENDQEESKDFSHALPSIESFSVPLTPNVLAIVKSVDSPTKPGSTQGKSLTKGSPSLSSLIQKDPKLYDSISEIVDSIDSYEKMLDLCGDRGQKEIDDALKRDPIPMPNNLLCFECGELLVDGINFKSDGKVFHPSMTNAFKCINCEDEEEDDYGEPPVLMPHFDDISMDGDTEENEKKDFNDQMESNENFYGSDESLVEFRERLKKQHGVYFIGDEYSGQFDDNNKESGQVNSSYTVPIDFDESSNDLQDQDRNNNQNSSLDDSNQMQDPATSDASKPEYEAADPTIPSVFPCHLCTKVFASSSFLAQHLDLHKKSPHKCMVCGKTFTSGPALKRHMRLHTGEKPYACPLCKKQFRDPSNFGKHKKSCNHSHANDNGISVPSPLDSCSTNSAHSSLSAEEHMDKSNGSGGIANRFVSSHIIGGNLLDNGVDKMEHFEEEQFPIMSVTPALDDDLMDLPVDEDILQNNDGGEDINGEHMNYISCDICQKLCENKDHLEMHMHYHTGNPDVTCIECGKAFADAFGMKRHMRIHLGIKPFSCEYCGRGYCDNWSLKKHKSKGCVAAEVQVPIDLLHPCQKCSKVFSDTENLQEHMKMHKGLMKYECDVCNKRFSEAFNLKKHRRLHMAICPGCGQEFSNVKIMKAHQELECSASIPSTEETDPNKSFSCDVCGRVYSTRAYLDRHRKIHSELKPHVCEICNKRFSEAFKLRRHKKSSHSDLKPFACQDCGKSFSDDAALKRHSVSSSCALSKATGEPLNSETCICQLCDKVFQKNYMLVRHMTVHSQNRPFSCDVCGRSYKDTSSLKRHQMTHLGVKDFICPVCGKDFYYSDSLKRHMGGRCGKKTKGRRRKAASKKGKKYTHPQNNLAKNDILNNNNNSIDDVLTNSWKYKLHTTPYVPSIREEASHSFMVIPSKGNGEDEYGMGNIWSCRYKRHCWKCDIRLPSVTALMAHRRTHRHKKPFKCHKCFLRFQSKMYWKAHTSICRKLKPVVTSGKTKISRKRTAAEVNSSPCVPPSETVELGERKRPRRSVPRAQWTWISQI